MPLHFTPLGVVVEECELGVVPVMGSLELMCSHSGLTRFQAIRDAADTALGDEAAIDLPYKRVRKLFVNKIST